jgi:protein-disulfide isomerase
MSRVFLAPAVVVSGPTSVSLKQQSAAVARAATPGNAPNEAVPTEVVDIGKLTTQGMPNARVALVEVTDFECPFCALHDKNVYEELVRDYVRSGRISYSILNLPIENAHRGAFGAAMAAECAGKQGKYWEMRRTLFAHPKDHSPMRLMEHGAKVGLASAELNRCLQDSSMADRVREQMAVARKLIGQVKPDGTVMPVRMLRGYQSSAALRREIDVVLASGGAVGR